MPIQPQRIAEDIRVIAGITQTPGHGATRPTFSDQWRQACDYVAGEAGKIGGICRIDAHGNWHIRSKSIGWDQRVWLSGSHLDSVPHGGDYDGVAGVVAPLEVLRASVEDGQPAGLELIIFAEEEGTTFGVGMLGSRSWVGDISEQDLSKLHNSDGQSYLQAGVPHGVDPKRMPPDRISADHYIGLIELHIEQGPGMWKRDERLAVVTAIAGRRQYQCEIRGQANHAGSTSMSDRRDALAGTAEFIVQLESMASSLDPHAVVTVGRLGNNPNAINVIPDRVTFTIDFRAPRDDVLARGEAQIQQVADRIARQRKLGHHLQITESIAAVEMDAKVCKRLITAGGGQPTTISGALHDSAVIAPHLPTAMLFIPSKDGISHNPAEFSRIEDIAAAARVLAAAVSDAPPS